jgi:hypothetical protein
VISPGGSALTRRRRLRFPFTIPRRRDGAVLLVQNMVSSAMVERVRSSVFLFRLRSRLGRTDPSQVPEEPDNYRDHYYDEGAKEYQQRYLRDAQRILLLQRHRLWTRA